MKVTNTRLTGFLATTFPKIAFGIGILGAAFLAFFFKQDPHHFYFAYLTVFMIFLTLTLGSLFFVLIQHLVRAGWSIGFKRIAETLMSNSGLMALLFIPIIFGIPHLYHWSNAAEVAKDPLLNSKHAFLNIPFFKVRALFYFGIWITLSRVFYKKSTEQDSSGDPENTVKMQKYSTFGILLFALSITFACIDWVMSLTPHWYSTMIGVYFFAGSVVVALSTISCIAQILRSQGYLKEVLTVEHFHEIGKLLYGFNVFWAYIAFSQYFLIWYANIPEEIAFYLEHFKGTWNTVAIFLVLGHFVGPFILFMSRHAKRNLPFHFAITLWFIFMQMVDMYWFVMPNFNINGFHIGGVELAALSRIGGLYLGTFFTRLSKQALYPIQDPRISESIHLENL